MGNMRHPPLSNLKERVEMTATLASTIWTGPRLTNGTIRWAHIDDHSTLPFILRLLLTIYFVPLEWRKWAINVCRIQEDPMLNRTLLDGYAELVDSTVVTIGMETRAIGRDHFRDLMRNFYDSPMELSLISYMMRAEKFYNPREPEQVRDETLQKELNAALFFEPHQPKLDYHDLFEAPTWIRPAHQDSERVPVGGGSTGRLFRTGLTAMKNRFSSVYKTK